MNRKQGVLILHVMCITQSVLRNHSIDRLICFALRRIHGILAKFKTRTSKKKNQNQVTVVKGYLYRWFCEYQVQTQITDKVRKFCFATNHQQPSKTRNKMTTLNKYYSPSSIIAVVMPFPV
jgi:hypothetical protein